MSNTENPKRTRFLQRKDELVGKGRLSSADATTVAYGEMLLEKLTKVTTQEEIAEILGAVIISNFGLSRAYDNRFHEFDRDLQSRAAVARAAKL